MSWRDVRAFFTVSELLNGTDKSPSVACDANVHFRLYATEFAERLVRDHVCLCNTTTRLGYGGRDTDRQRLRVGGRPSK